MKKQKVPKPRAARLAKGMKWRDLAALARIGVATISRCESSGRWPKNPHVRAAYMGALGLVDSTAATGDLTGVYGDHARNSTASVRA